MKYGTDDLIRTLDYQVNSNTNRLSTPEILAVMKRLRAADALLNAAKYSVDNCSCNCGGITDGGELAKQPCDRCDPLSKAIAAYEGKEDQ